MIDRILMVWAMAALVGVPAIGMYLLAKRPDGETYLSGAFLGSLCGGLAGGIAVMVRVYTASGGAGLEGMGLLYMLALAAGVGTLTGGAVGLAAAAASRAARKKTKSE